MRFYINPGEKVEKQGRSHVFVVSSLFVLDKVYKEAILQYAPLA